ncbi:MerR family transcriptional regulator [Alkalicoccobacillus gibsonii]|uniref:MerR family transcriptional regulator n=1 Tax=Alkalicoccobacillus gibsonii TaxID=79881 RepID=UPI003F7CB079
MDKMLAVSELSTITKIPESTVRRYLNKFHTYFKYDSRGKGKKYHAESVEILNQIAGLYGEGYQANEIETILAEQFPITITDSPDATTLPPPHKPLEKQFEEFKEQQNEFNQELLAKLDRQQRFIKQLLQEKRDQDLLENEKETAASSDSHTAPKKWWEFWKRKN